MLPLQVELIPVLEDNYAYLLRDQATGAIAIVDPPVVEPVMQRVAAHGGKLDAILLTHHHGDHIAGAPELVQRTGAIVTGPAADAHRIPSMDRGVREGDRIEVGSCAARVIETPGHTTGHVSFLFEQAKVLFCGDTLFALGCGRVLEGDMATMWRSLQKLAALPGETVCYCGHEYTASNARFALHADPANAALRARADRVARARAAGEPTIPFTIAEELATNPFLRAGSAERFEELRRGKDKFRG